MNQKFGEVECQKTFKIEEDAKQAGSVKLPACSLMSDAKMLFPGDDHQGEITGLWGTTRIFVDGLKDVVVEWLRLSVELHGLKGHAA